MRYGLLVLALLWGMCGLAWAGLDEGLAALEGKDYAAARKELLPLAKKGNARAQNALGLMYHRGGASVVRNDREAVRWFRKAAAQGDAEGQFHLGLMYCEGMGVARDVRQAIRWYLKAADQGNTQAQYRIGELYVTGTGVRRDEREAARWYRRAADGGNPEAMRAMGDFCEKGRGGLPKDNGKAREWYDKAKKAKEGQS